jgi:hypothetical protein
MGTGQTPPLHNFLNEGQARTHSSLSHGKESPLRVEDIEGRGTGGHSEGGGREEEEVCGKLAVSVMHCTTLGLPRLSARPPWLSCAALSGEQKRHHSADG